MTPAGAISVKKQNLNTHISILTSKLYFCTKQDRHEINGV